MLSLGRAEAVLRSRAGAGNDREAQPNKDLAFTVIERSLRSLQALKAVVTPAQRPLERALDLLTDIVADGKNDLKEPPRCAVLADRLRPFVGEVEGTVRSLFQQAWDGSLAAEVTERAAVEFASLIVWRGRDYECLTADLQRLLLQIPSGQALAAVLCPTPEPFRVAAVVEGARTLAHLPHLLGPAADVRQFPLGKKEPDGWGPGNAKLRKFAALHRRRAGEDPREEERTAAAVLLTLRVTAPDRGVAVQLARRRTEEALDAYVAGNRLAELRLAPRTLVYQEADNRSRRYTSHGATLDAAQPLTSHWPPEIRECLRTAHIARSTSSPLTSAALSWAAIEAAGIHHGNTDAAQHVDLARALSLQAMRQQLISSHQCVRLITAATYEEVKERAEAAGRALDGLERHAAARNAAPVPPALQTQLQKARARAADAARERADADDLYLQALHDVDKAAPVNSHGLLDDINSWVDMLAASGEAGRSERFGSPALSRLRPALPGLPAHDIDVWQARLTNPEDCATWLAQVEERYRAQLSWMYVLRNTALHQGVFASVADSHDAHGARGTVDLMLEVLGNWYASATRAGLPQATWTAQRVVAELSQRQQDLIGHLKAAVDVTSVNVTHLTSPTSNGRDRG
ncbi:hypothetical protein [Streptomyces sp. LN785]|uniref:hypothetical protein n=1 Tax=Streptomyces sp. LN785 TaxID=3112983 RepID=UPI003716F646